MGVRGDGQTAGRYSGGWGGGGKHWVAIWDGAVSTELTDRVELGVRGEVKERQKFRRVQHWHFFPDCVC